MEKRHYDGWKWAFEVFLCTVTPLWRDRRISFFSSTQAIAVDGFRACCVEKRTL